MKNKFLSILLLCIFFLSASQIQAHMLRTDGTIGAVVHIDPDDDPYIGETSDVFFEIKDTSKKFSGAACACTIQVWKGERLLDTLIASADDTHVKVRYLYPEKGIYTLVLKGEPTQAGSFQSFSLSYDFRVARERAKAGAEIKMESSVFPPLPAVVVFSMIAGVVIGIWYLYRRKNI